MSRRVNVLLYSTVNVYSRVVSSDLHIQYRPLAAGFKAYYPTAPRAHILCSFRCANTNSVQSVHSIQHHWCSYLSVVDDGLLEYSQKSVLICGDFQCGHLAPVPAHMTSRFIARLADQIQPLQRCFCTQRTLQRQVPVVFTKESIMIDKQLTHYHSEPRLQIFYWFLFKFTCSVLTFKVTGRVHTGIQFKKSTTFSWLFQGTFSIFHDTCKP